MIMSKFKDLFLIVEGGHFSDREIKKENKKKVRGKDMTKFFVKKPYFVLVSRNHCPGYWFCQSR